MDRRASGGEQNKTKRQIPEQTKANPGDKSGIKTGGQGREEDTKSHI